MMEVLAWTIVVLIASAYAYKVILRKPSSRKMILLLPLLPLFLYLPWLPSSCYVRTILAIVLLWTAPSKLLLLCFNRPLDPFPHSFFHFLVAVFLPIHISSLSSAAASSGSGYGYGYLGEFLLLVGIYNMFAIFPAMPSPLLYFLYCIQFYIGFDFLLEGLAHTVERMSSMKLYAQFNEPLRSESLTDFWGHRWNLTINSILKDTVYKPLLRRHVSKSIATLATFAMSAVIHEVLFVYVSHSGPTGEMTVFFLLHGLATVGQVAICKRWPALRGLPTWICRALTLTFLYATVSFFFMRPLRRSKTDVRALGLPPPTRGLVVTFSNCSRTFYNLLNDLVHLLEGFLHLLNNLLHLLANLLLLLKGLF